MKSVNSDPQRTMVIPQYIFRTIIGSRKMHDFVIFFQNVVFVMTTVDGGKCHSSLKRRLCTEVTVGGLDMFDKAEVVRNNLAVYRKKLDESPFTNQVTLLYHYQVLQCTLSHIGLCTQ